MSFLAAVIASGMSRAFAPIVATGGTVTDIDVGGRMYRVHDFTSSGNFDISDAGSDRMVERLWVGGAAGGPHVTSADFPCGGGAGGEVKSDSGAVTAGSYPVVIGNGGASVTGTNNGNPGGATTAFGVSAAGGGYGGTFNMAGGNAVNGGGGGCSNVNGTNPAGGTGTRNGGQGFGAATAANRASGGGAGAGTAGGNASSLNGGFGGDGVLSSIDGTPRYYGAGAGGMARDGTPGAAGLGGVAGVLTNSAPHAGTDGLGNGGTGSTGTGAGLNSGKGGKGRFIIRYPLEAA